MINNLDVLLLNLSMSISAKTVVAKFKSLSPLGLFYIGTVLQKICLSNNFTNSPGLSWKLYVLLISIILGKEIYMRSPENILEELMFIEYKFNYNMFFIVDDTFTINTKNVKASELRRYLQLFSKALISGSNKIGWNHL